MSIGRRIKDEREHRSLSLSRLHKATGVSVGFLWNIEHGDQIPSRERVTKIAEGLEGLDPQELIDERDKTEFQRQGLDEGAAHVSVALNRPNSTIENLRAALEQLDPERREKLHAALSGLLEERRADTEMDLATATEHEAQDGEPAEREFRAETASRTTGTLHGARAR